MTTKTREHSGTSVELERPGRLRLWNPPPISHPPTARRAATPETGRAGARPSQWADDDTDGERTLTLLIELGVVSERPDGRIDVPHIYRYGFGILRKGGVKRPR